jgi:hypothetical protein
MRKDKFDSWSVWSPSITTGHIVCCQLDVLNGQLEIFALRRRQPDWQPLLQVAPYEIHIVPWYKS